MKIADSLSFVPMVLALGVALSLPSAQDQSNVAQVRDTMSTAAKAVTKIFTDGSSSTQATVKVAEVTRETHEYWRTTYPESHSRKAGGVQQTWENRPSGRDYANGRAVRMNYGESQRNLDARRR